MKKWGLSDCRSSSSACRGPGQNLGAAEIHIQPSKRCLHRDKREVSAAVEEEMRRFSHLPSCPEECVRLLQKETRMEEFEEQLKTEILHCPPNLTPHPMREMFYLTADTSSSNN